jgi:hypothetical protein
MKTRWALVASMTLVACDEGAVDLGAAQSVPSAPSPYVTAYCGTKPSVLAWVAGVKASTLALDFANVYVVASQPGVAAHEIVMRIPKRGGAPDIIAEHQDAVADLGARWYGTSATVVWTTRSTGGDAGVLGAVWKFDDASGKASILAGNRTSPGPVLFGDDVVYWAEQQADANGQPIGAVVSTAISGGGAITLVQATGAPRVPSGFDFGSWMLYWTTADPAIGDYASAEILGVQVAQPAWTAERIAGPESGGAAAILTLDDGSLVYGGPTALYVFDGSAPPKPLVSTSGFVQRMRGSCVGLCYVDPGERALMVAPAAAGGAPTEVAADVDPASAFDVDARCVYWVDAVKQAVMMVRL